MTAEPKLVAEKAASVARELVERRRDAEGAVVEQWNAAIGQADVVQKIERCRHLVLHQADMLVLNQAVCGARDIEHVEIILRHDRVVHRTALEVTAVVEQLLSRFVEKYA